MKTRNEFIHNLFIKFIPKWYKDKYHDRIGNMKYSSGYWFDYILPRKILHYYPTSHSTSHLYRWFNIFITKTYNKNTCKHRHTHHEDIVPSSDLSQFICKVVCNKCHKQVGVYRAPSKPEPPRNLDKVLIILTGTALVLTTIITVSFIIATINMIIDHKCTNMPFDEAKRLPECEPYLP